MYRLLEESGDHALNGGVYSHLEEHFPAAVLEGDLAVFTVVGYFSVVKVSIHCAVSVLEQRHYLADIIRCVEGLRVAGVNTRSSAGSRRGNLSLGSKYLRRR